MSFHTTGATGGGELYDIVFRQILQVPGCVGGNTYGCLTGELQSDLIFALIIPHVILLMYLFIISRSTGLFSKHPGLGTLFGATVYIFLVFTGWYGTLAFFLVWWLVITLVISLGYFFLAKIVHPSETGTQFQLGRAIRKRVEQGKANADDRKRLRKFLKDLEKRRDRVKDEYTNTPDDQTELRSELRKELKEIENAIRETKDTIRKLR